MADIVVRVNKERGPAQIFASDTRTRSRFRRWNGGRSQLNPEGAQSKKYLPKELRRETERA